MKISHFFIPAVLIVLIAVCFSLTSHGMTGFAAKEDGESCKNNSECASGRCNASICCSAERQCCANVHCSSKESCSNYQCTRLPSTQKAKGGNCSSNSDCISENCENSVCCASGRGCCKSDSDCLVGGGYICGKDYYCIKSEPKKANGFSCSKSSECISGNCNNSICCQAGVCCSANVSCSSGYECKDYACVEKKVQENLTQTNVSEQVKAPLRADSQEKISFWKKIWNWIMDWL